MEVSIFNMKKNVVYSCSLNSRYYRINSAGKLENSTSPKGYFDDCDYTYTSARFTPVENEPAVKINALVSQLEEGFIYRVTKNFYSNSYSLRGVEYVYSKDGYLYDKSNDEKVEKVDMRSTFTFVRPMPFTRNFEESEMVLEKQSTSDFFEEQDENDFEIRDHTGTARDISTYETTPNQIDTFVEIDGDIHYALVGSERHQELKEETDLYRMI